MGKKSSPFAFAVQKYLNKELTKPKSLKKNISSYACADLEE